jgi:hypothetical protein
MGADFVPWLSPHLSYFVIYYKSTPQRTGSDWKNLPGTAQFLSTQTDIHHVAFIYKIVKEALSYIDFQYTYEFYFFHKIQIKYLQKILQKILL